MEVERAIEILQSWKWAAEAAAAKEAFDMAINALERQIPKKPDAEQKTEQQEGNKAIYLGFSRHDCESYYKCPVCNKVFGDYMLNDEIKHGTEQECPICKSKLIF